MKQLDRAMIKYEYYVVIEVRRHMHIMQKRCLFLLHCYIALVIKQLLSQCQVTIKTTVCLSNEGGSTSMPASRRMTYFSIWSAQRALY